MTGGGTQTSVAPSYMEGRAMPTNDPFDFTLAKNTYATDERVKKIKSDAASLLTTGNIASVLSNKGLTDAQARAAIGGAANLKAGLIAAGFNVVDMAAPAPTPTPTPVPTPTPTPTQLTISAFAAPGTVIGAYSGSASPATPALGDRFRTNAGAAAAILVVSGSNALTGDDY